jgi:hypothetical protein
MGLAQASIQELKAHAPNHGHLYSATTHYYEGPLVEAELDSLLQALSTSRELASDGRACVVFGYGSRPRWVYSELRANAGARVLWDGAFVPWPLLPISWIAAAHGGLVQVVERSALPEVFRTLSELAMVEMYSFDSARLEAVVQAAKTGRWRARIGPLAGADLAYFSLGVDGDNHESADGLLAWVSFGGECPMSLRVAGTADRANGSGLAV